MPRPARAPLLRRLLLLAAVAASCSYYLLFLQAQASVPPRYDGFAYGGGAAAAWKDAVLVEAFLDPLCPDSRDSWHPLKLAIERYAPRVSLIVHPFPLP